jgi:hypothetical protein
MTKILACPILVIDNNMRHKYTIYIMYLLYMVVISFAAVVGPGTRWPIGCPISNLKTDKKPAGCHENRENNSLSLVFKQPVG